MTWTPLDEVAVALTRLSTAIGAAFQGRTSQLPAAVFVPDAIFIAQTDALTVTFTDGSTAGAGNITAWLWDFGDNETSTSQSPTHVYAAEGTYLVSLTVTNSAGQQAQSFQAVTILEMEVANLDPVANFTTSVNGLTVTFTDTSTDADGSVVDWDYDFGDSNPTAAFSSVVTGLSVAFTDASTDVSPGTITARLWDFGDGQTSTSTNPTHVYAAGGGYNVTLLVTDDDNHQASVSAVVQVTQGATLGLPFGVFNLWSTSPSAPIVSPGVFTASIDAWSASNCITRINAARDLGHKLESAMTGGAHSNYITGTSFDLVKWKAKMDTYDTTAIRTAVAAAVLDGTLLGNSVMDEPEHPSWGAAGVMTRVVIDEMADYVRAIFPTLPVGVVHGPFGYYLWRPSERYTSIDYVQAQYNWSVNSGNITDFRNKTLAQATLDGVAVVFSINLLDGGFRIDGCPTPQTGGPGTFSINCRMTAAQVEEYGLFFGPAGSAFFMWQYNTAFMADAGNIAAFAAIADDLATRPTKSWLRIT